MLTHTDKKELLKMAGLGDMLGGAMETVGDYMPEGLGALTGAGSAAGLAGMGGLGSKGQAISAAIGATIGALAASKMKDHEKMQEQTMDANGMLGINNAMMNLDQDAMLSGMYGGGMDPYAMGMGGGPGMGMGMGMPGMGPGMGPGAGMMDGSGMDPNTGMPIDPNMLAGLDPNMGAMVPPSQPINGFPQAQQAMQTKQSSANIRAQASELVDKYFG